MDNRNNAPEVSGSVEALAYVDEVWEVVPGFESFYEASNLGRIKMLGRIASTRRGKKRLTAEKIVTPTLAKNGHWEVELHHVATRCKRRVSRCVFEAFIGPKIQGLQIVHLDGDLSNSRLLNLHGFVRQ